MILLPNLSLSCEGVGGPKPAAHGEPYIISTSLRVEGGLFVLQGGLYIIPTL